MSAFDSAGFESWAEQNDVAGDPPKGEKDWPDPEPIRNELRAVAPLRPEMIPEPFRACYADIAHRMQCPIDFVASASICMISGVIGAGCTDPAKRAGQLGGCSQSVGWCHRKAGHEKDASDRRRFPPVALVGG